MFNNEKRKFDFTFEIDTSIVKRELSGTMMANNFASIKSTNLTVAKNEAHIQYLQCDNKYFFVIRIDKKETIEEAKSYDRFVL